MHQAGALSALGEDLLDPRLLAEIAMAADKLDLQAGLGGQPLGGRSQLLAQRLGPARVVEQADALGAEPLRHGPSVSDVGQRAGDDDAVEARRHPGDVLLVTFDKRVHRGASAVLDLPITIDRRPFLVPAAPG